MGLPPFQTFLDDQRDTVFRFLVATVGPDDAEDCFQETFISALRAYPRLKANENMLALQDELTSTENRIAFTRQGYNDAVMDYNLPRARFPISLVAGLFGFAPAEPLQATESVVERTTAPVASR